jgi:hypothetical protein
MPFDPKQQILNTYFNKELRTLNSSGLTDICFVAWRIVFLLYYVRQFPERLIF